MSCGVKTGGLVHHHGGCYDCDASWSSRNVIGVAARHHQATGHATWAETGHVYGFGGDPGTPDSHGAGLASRLKQ